MGMVQNLIQRALSAYLSHKEMIFAKYIGILRKKIMP
jgi:hypothetical protein